VELYSLVVAEEVQTIMGVLVQEEQAAVELEINLALELLEL
jgi:hypothetical protein